MRILKIKNVFFSLVAVALLGFLVTSCERPEITTVLKDTVNIGESISDEKLPISPEEVLKQAETPDDIVSRSCKIDGCIHYISSLTLSSVTAKSSNRKVYVYFYNQNSVYIPGSVQVFTPQIGNCISETYNFNAPNGACLAAAFVNGSNCGISWTAPLNCIN